MELLQLKDNIKVVGQFQIIKHLENELTDEISNDENLGNLLNDLKEKYRKQYKTQTI